MRVPYPSLLLLIPSLQRRSAHRTGAREYATFFGSIIQASFNWWWCQRLPRYTLGVVQTVAREFSRGELAGFPAPIGKGGALIEGLKLAEAVA